MIMRSPSIHMDDHHQSMAYLLVTAATIFDAIYRNTGDRLWVESEDSHRSVMEAVRAISIVQGELSTEKLLEMANGSGLDWNSLKVWLHTAATYMQARVDCEGEGNGGTS